MFGSKAKQELQMKEDMLRNVREQLSKAEKEKASLEKELNEAMDAITSLQAELSDARENTEKLRAELMDTDYEALKEKSRETIAEYEGLRDLYTRKNQEFDDAREEAEQAFAREAALERFNLENEIQENRQANQEFVANTVKSFGESYNYYLNQIKVLMDALSDVAARTGSTLFAQPAANLKEDFGQQMVGRLKSGADELRGEEGDRIVIGSAEEEAEPEISEDAAEGILAEAAEEAAEMIEEAAEEKAEEAVEEAEESAEEAVQAAEDIAEEAAADAEEAEEAVEALAEEVNDAAQDLFTEE